MSSERESTMSNAKNFRSGRHVVYDLHAHIVLTPKYRRKVMTPSVHETLEKSISETCLRWDVILEEFNTDNDHAHILVSYPPKVRLSDFIGAMKTRSAKDVREHNYEEIKNKLWGKHFWSPSYFIASTGGAPLEKVKKYIENQGKEPRKPGNPQWLRNNSSSPH